MLSGGAAQHPTHLSQPFFVAEQLTGLKGRYVKIADTIEDFDKLAKGELDEYPE